MTHQQSIELAKESAEIVAKIHEIIAGKNLLAGMAALADVAVSLERYSGNGPGQLDRMIEYSRQAQDADVRKSN